MSTFGRPRPIAAEDDTSAFHCGEQSLDNWIQLRAARNEKLGASRTFVTIERESGTIAGYYCLSANSLTHSEATPSLRRNMPEPIPVILIGRLAVDEKFKGLGVGASLLQDALSKGIDASRIVGARAFVVHALSEKAESFYAKFGFTPVPDSERVMYIKVQDAEATLSSLLR